MSRTQFEIVEIEKANISFDVSMVAYGEIWFNATDIAKCFGKKPKDWLRVAENKKYIDVVSQRENMPFEKLVKTTRGGKYKGTWLHKKLALPFARWCDQEFAYDLDCWIVNRIKQEKKNIIARLAAKTGYLPMSEAVTGAHDPAKFYHYSTEAEMINRLVLGMTAKKFKKYHNVDNVRDALSESQLNKIDRLQRINTGLIEVGMTYAERKEHLSKYYAVKLLQAAQVKESA